MILAREKFGGKGDRYRGSGIVSSSPLRIPALSASRPAKSNP
ncbi:hypothetical protein [Paenibacillus sp. JSM ZJ436]